MAGLQRVAIRVSGARSCFQAEHDRCSTNWRCDRWIGGTSSGKGVDSHGRSGNRILLGKPEGSLKSTSYC
jgi:hypothetical protein